MGQFHSQWGIGLAVLLATATPAAVRAAPSDPVVGISIGHPSGSRGDVVQFDVTLNLLTTPGAPVVRVEHDIRFAPAVAVTSGVLDQGPACAVNPGIHKEATTFTLAPAGCVAQGNCTGLHAIVSSTSNQEPIPDGATLYTCTILIHPEAPLGVSPLVNNNPSARDPEGEELDTIGDAGAVTVSQPRLACVGDCGGDGEITIDDLIVGVNIDLGQSSLATCPAFDRDDDGTVAVNELIQAVSAALNGCAPTADVCERTAATSLRTCVEQVNDAERTCFLTAGTACPPDDAAVSAALATLADDVGAQCPNTATVRGVGYGPSFTPAGLVSRLQAACRAEPASLAARTFGGPQGAGLAAGTAQAVACLTETHELGTRLMRDQLALYSNCVLGARTDDSCAATQTDAPAAALEQQLAADVAAACGAGTLQDLVAVDEASYAARTAAQVRCLTATAHADPSPLALDCGPRDSLADTPRGEYVQIVLDEAETGTRCGDGSPYAFWIRLAPEGEPVDHVVVGLQGGGVCIFGADCAAVPSDLFEAMSDSPEDGGTLSNDPTVSPFAAWTKVYLPYCTQDVFIGGGTTTAFPEVTVRRFGAPNVRGALRYTRDVLWRELDRTTEDGYRADRLRVLFGGFSAGGFGTLYNYHWVLDDLQWAHTAAYPDAGLALDNGTSVGVAALGQLLFTDTPPLGWGARNYAPSYCFATDCGVGPVLLQATSPRLKAVPEQQFLILSNQVDQTQVDTTFFPSTASWINAMRASYCATRELPGVQYYLPAITQSVHVISQREELYTNRPVGGVVMRDWLASGFTAPDAVTDQVEEGTLVDDYPGVLPFDCPVSP